MLGFTPTRLSEVAAMVHENPDPYRVLGVSPTASQAEITHAYRTRLRAHHPDTRHPPSSQSAAENLPQVLATYALRHDPARRPDYANPTPHTTTTPEHAHGPTKTKN